MIPASAHADTPPGSSRTSRRGPLVAALVCLGLLLTALAPATAAEAKVPKSFFGITEGGSLAPPDFEQMHGIKVRTFRVTISWRLTEPARGKFDWSRTDNVLSLLARNGISPAFVVWGAPQWATHSSEPAVPPLKGKSQVAWKAFLNAAVKRYKKGGTFWKTHPSLPEKPANTWQIWNEPNLAKYFAKRGTHARKPVPHAGRAYAKLVKLSDKAIHKADKHAKVILAGLSGNAKGKKLKPNKFIKSFLKAHKIKKRFDAAALHPYASNFNAYRSRVSSFRKALKEGGAKKKGLWLSEVGWGSSKNGQRSNKGPKGQARLLEKSFKETLKMRKKWNVDHLYWFEWRDQPPGTGGCSFCRSAGLLRFDRTKKPAYRKFEHFANMQGNGGHQGHHHRH
jgi:polysaccharide biosynthesis protein PslG